MYFINYNPKTLEVISFLDASLGVFATEDDGTEYFSITDEQYQEFVGKKCYTDGKYITAEPRPSECATLCENGWTESEELKQQVLQAHKAQAVHDIDTAVANIYQKFNMYATEYELRESQARDFKSNNYEGDVPRQVAAFATPAGLTPQQATDLIIQQADMGAEVRDQLAELRMRKYEVLQLTAIQAVDDTAATILNSIKAIGDSL